MFGVELTAVTLDSLQEYFLSSNDALRLLQMIEKMEPLLAAKSKNLTDRNAWLTEHADGPSFLFAVASLRDGKMTWWPSEMSVSDATLLVSSGHGLIRRDLHLLNNPILGKDYTDFSVTMKVMEALQKGIEVMDFDRSSCRCL